MKHRKSKPTGKVHTANSTRQIKQNKSVWLETTPTLQYAQCPARGNATGEGCVDTEGSGGGDAGGKIWFGTDSKWYEGTAL